MVNTIVVWVLSLLSYIGNNCVTFGQGDGWCFANTHTTLTLYFQMTCLHDYTAWNGLHIIPDVVFRRHSQRLVLNVLFLSLLVFHENTALNEYVAVTELSPGDFSIY